MFLIIVRNAFFLKYDDRNTVQVYLKKMLHYVNKIDDVIWVTPTNEGPSIKVCYFLTTRYILYYHFSSEILL